MPEPALPVVDEGACPFEGCSFRKWIVSRDAELFSTWKQGRRMLTNLHKGQIVTGETGVHITWKPDRIEVLQPIAELDVKRGDLILRYMYHGEGFADIWAKGYFVKEYDCSFVKEKEDGGCTRNCAAKVVEDGRKDWWVRVKTAQDMVGWSEATDQFGCMDALGGDPQCEELQGASSSTQ